MPITTGGITTPTTGDAPNIPADMLRLATDLAGKFADLDTRFVTSRLDLLVQSGSFAGNTDSAGAARINFPAAYVAPPNFAVCNGNSDVHITVSVYTIDTGGAWVQAIDLNNVAYASSPLRANWFAHGTPA